MTSYEGAFALLKERGMLEGDVCCSGAGDTASSDVRDSRASGRGLRFVSRPFEEAGSKGNS